MTENIDYYNKSPKLRVRVNNELIRSRQPHEHFLKITTEYGRIVQALEDGYCLIEFGFLKIEKSVNYIEKNSGKRIYDKKEIPLQWYVHRDDFKQASNRGTFE